MRASGRGRSGAPISGPPAYQPVMEAKEIESLSILIPDHAEAVRDAIAETITTLPEQLRRSLTAIPPRSLVS